jgi:hypothetical protein
MKKPLQARAKKLEEKLQPQEVHNPIRFNSDEWNELTEQEQAEIHDKHSLVIIITFVPAKDGKPDYSAM